MRRRRLRFGWLSSTADPRRPGPPEKAEFVRRSEPTGRLEPPTGGLLPVVCRWVVVFAT